MQCHKHPPPSPHPSLLELVLLHPTEGVLYCCIALDSSRNSSTAKHDEIQTSTIDTTMKPLSACLWLKTTCPPPLEPVTQSRTPLDCFASWPFNKSKPHAVLKNATGKSHLGGVIIQQDGKVLRHGDGWCICLFPDVAQATHKNSHQKHHPPHPANKKTYCCIVACQGG